MMKKVLSMLLFVAAAFATSCDKIDDLGDDLKDQLEDLGDDNKEDAEEYVGSVVVNGGEEIDATFFLDEDGDNDTVSVLMKNIMFDPHMPAMDITLEDMAEEDGEFSAEKATTSVVLFGQPADASAFPVTNVSGTYNDNTLEVSFTCTVKGQPYNVSFEGRSK